MLPFAAHFQSPSQLVYGCMGLGGGWNDNPITVTDKKQAQAVLETCVELGINVLDLADIYQRGKSEQVIGEVLSQSSKLRDHFIIQTKCGIRMDQHQVKRYDLSHDYIIACFNESLERLRMDHIDLLLLHRPDPLSSASETARALNELLDGDGLSAAGCSNMHAAQMAQLQTHVGQPLIVNQLQLSLGHRDFIEDLIGVNTAIASQSGFPRGTLEYCQQQSVQIQAWSPLDKGRFLAPNDDPDVDAVYRLLRTLAEQHKVTPEAIQTAWLMRLPMHIQPVIGTTDVVRLRRIAMATQVTLSHSEWYELLTVARGHKVP